MSRDPAPAELPAVIDRYQVRAVLGRGAFGTVYRAVDPRLDREVALKVLRPELTTSKQAVERFLREARAAARLLHPHIVPVHDAGQAGTVYFIASAFIPGRTLADALPEGGMAPRQALELVAQLAAALAYAHRQGVLHRDVKPENILLDEQGSLYLMDFGLAAWVQDEGTRLTQAGAVMGTPAYMAPEQASGETRQIGPATDLWSAGVVLYELLTGRRPFEGHPAALVWQILNKTPEPPSQHRPALDPQLDALCLKALAKAPAERYPGGDEMAAALRGVGPSATESFDVWDESGTRPPKSRGDQTASDRAIQATADPGAPVPKVRRPRAASRRPWMLSATAAVAVLAALACGILVFALHQPATTAGPATSIAPDHSSPPSVPHEDKPPPPPPHLLIVDTFSGKVVGVDGDKLTILTDKGERTFPVPATATVRKDDKDNKLDALWKDDTVTVTTHDGVVFWVDAKYLPGPAPAKAPFDAAEAKRLQQAWADYLGRQVEEEDEIAPGVRMKFVLIPPGVFLMGSPPGEDGRGPNEGPQHQVEITKPFSMGVYPVTKGQFAAFVKEGGYQTEAEKANDTSTWRKSFFSNYTQSDDDPVVEVTWNDAVKFCEWLSKKEGRTYGLPTEAEWEYACRAGTKTAFSFGDDPKSLGDYTWYDGNSESHTHPVGQKKPNPWGLCDMHGNVWQWCADYYQKDDYANSHIKDPQNTYNSGEGLLLRGGSWYVAPRVCRSAVRLNDAPGRRSLNIGFRVVLRVPARTP